MQAFNPFEKQHQKVLLLIPHQDDEICILSMLHRHVENQDAVQVVWAAVDGNADLAVLRKQESQKAMQAAGIPRTALEFLDFPQLVLFNHIPDLIAKFMEILAEVQPHIIYCPAFEGGHLDHDTVHYCAVQAARQSETRAKVLEFPLYNSNRRPGVIQRIPRFGAFLPSDREAYVYTLNAEQIRRRKQWWKGYKSQTGLFNMLIFLSGSRRSFWAREQVRCVPSYDYSMPPHPGRLNYECNFPQTFADFRQAVHAYEETI